MPRALASHVIRRQENGEMPRPPAIVISRRALCDVTSLAAADHCGLSLTFFSLPLSRVRFFHTNTIAAPARNFPRFSVN